MSVLKLLDSSVSLVLYSAWPLSSRILLETEISDLSFERSNSSSLDAVSYLYIYIILFLGTSVHGMKHWVLALTILRGEEQNTIEMSALLWLKEEYYSVCSQRVSSCDEAKFLSKKSTVIFILQISNWDINKHNIFTEIVDGALREPVHLSEIWSNQLMEEDLCKNRENRNHWVCVRKHPQPPQTGAFRIVILCTWNLVSKYFLQWIRKHWSPGKPKDW